MNKDQYLRMCEQTGQEIDWDRCPPEQEDFPTSVHVALNIYNSLGSRIYPDVGYVGKDFTLLDTHFRLSYINEPKEQDWIIELLLFIDSYQISESQRKIKAEYDKIKKK